MKTGKCGVDERRHNVEKPAEVKLNRLLMRLIVSALLFLLVFFGGNLIPERICDVFGTVRNVIGAESVLPETVQTLGEAVTKGESFGTALRDWCVDTFLPVSEPEATEYILENHMENAGQFSAHLLPKLTVSFD